MNNNNDDTGTRAGLKQAPWWMRLALDVVMLKSTPLTAVVWGIFWLGTILHIGFACGYLKGFGMDGFAQSDDLKSITTEINQNLEKTRGDIAWLLMTQIHLSTSLLCGMRDPTLRANTANYIDQLENEYSAITKQSVPILPCPAPLPGGVP